MSRAAKSPATSETRKRLEDYFAEMASASPLYRSVGLSALLADNIDRIRLFEKQGSYRVMVNDMALTPGPALRRRSPSALIEAYEKAIEEIKALGKLKDPDIALELTFDEDDGSIFLDVDSEPPLKGQDLSTLVEAPDDQARAEEFSAPLDDDYLTALDASKALGVDKSTITRRIKANELIGFRLFKNALRIPKDQIKDGSVVGGVKKIIDLFDGDHKAAWYFLSSEIYYGDAAPRPIDRLRAARTKAQTEQVLKDLKAAKDAQDFGDHI